MNGFDFWTYFTGIMVAGFAVWESAAIIGGHREWTFTYKIRTWLGIEHAKPYAPITSAIFAIVMIVFTGWFVPHIVWGWWGGAP